MAIAQKGMNQFDELENLLRTLFQKMKELGIKLSFKNQPHDDRFQGVPLWKDFNGLDVGVKEGRLTFQKDGVLYQSRKKIEEITSTIIDWAKKKIESLEEIHQSGTRFLQMPKEVTFFSLSLSPGSVSVPLKWT